MEHDFLDQHFAAAYFSGISSPENKKKSVFLDLSYEKAAVSYKRNVDKANSQSQYSALVDSNQSQRLSFPDRIRNLRQKGYKLHKQKQGMREINKLDPAKNIEKEVCIDINQEHNQEEIIINEVAEDFSEFRMLENKRELCIGKLILISSKSKKMKKSTKNKVIKLLLALRTYSIRYMTCYQKSLLLSHNERFPNIKSIEKYIVKMSTDLDFINVEPYLTLLGMHTDFNPFLSTHRIDGTVALIPNMSTDRIFSPYHQATNEEAPISYLSIPDELILSNVNFENCMHLSRVMWDLCLQSADELRKNPQGETAFGEITEHQHQPVLVDFGPVELQLQPVQVPSLTAALQNTFRLCETVNSMVKSMEEDSLRRLREDEERRAVLEKNFVRWQRYVSIRSAKLQVIFMSEYFRCRRVFQSMIKISEQSRLILCGKSNVLTVTRLGSVFEAWQNRISRRKAMLKAVGERYSGPKVSDEQQELSVPPISLPTLGKPDIGSANNDLIRFGSCDSSRGPKGEDTSARVPRRPLALTNSASFIDSVTVDELGQTETTVRRYMTWPEGRGPVDEYDEDVPRRRNVTTKTKQMSDKDLSVNMGDFGESGRNSGPYSYSPDALGGFWCGEVYWEMYLTDEGVTYYFDAASGTSQWEDPREEVDDYDIAMFADG